MLFRTNPSLHDLPSGIAEANNRWIKVIEADKNCLLAYDRIISNYLSLDRTVDAKYWVNRLGKIRTAAALAKVDRYQALLALSRGNHTKAINYCKKYSARVNKDDDAGIYTLISNLITKGDLDSARACINNMHEDWPISEFGKLIQVKLLIAESKWDEAIKYLHDLKAYPNHQRVAERLLYRCFMNDRRHASAVSLCENMDAAVQTNKDYFLGKAKFKQQNYREAIQCFNAAIEGSGHIDSRIWLIRTLYAINEHDDAVAKADLTSALEEVDAVTAARCWEAAGVLSKAEVAYEKACVKSRSSSSWLMLVDFQMRYRRWGDAYISILQARELGIRSTELSEIKSHLQRSFATCGVSIPRNRLALENFDFKSSEAVVTELVNCLLKRPVKTLDTSVQSNTSRSKVLLIINSLGPGGAERQAVNLANGLVEHDDTLDVRVLCTYLDRQDQDRFYLSQVCSEVQTSQYYDRTLVLKAEDIPELRPYAELLSNIQPLSRQQLILQMAKSILELKPDVVHGWLDETFINTTLVCKMLGVKNVIGRWGSMPPGMGRTVTERDSSNIQYLQHAYKQIARFPDVKLSSNSRLTGDAYAELMGIRPEAVSIVYNGIDERKLLNDSAETEDLKVTLGIPEHCNVVGTVFRISEEKRPLMWVDVAEQIAKAMPDTHFVLVGAGPMECQVIDKVRSKGIDNFHLVGKQTNIGAWLNLFDVFLLTSRVEGVSNAVVEAQFCGCPVVAPNVGGLSEALLDQVTGYLLVEPTMNDFSNAVIKLLSEADSLKAMGKDAQIYARQKFSVPAMVANYRGLFFPADNCNKQLEKGKTVDKTSSTTAIARAAGC